MKAISDELKLHYSTASKIIKCMRIQESRPDHLPFRLDMIVTDKVVD